MTTKRTKDAQQKRFRRARDAKLLDDLKLYAELAVEAKSYQKRLELLSKVIFVTKELARIDKPSREQRQLLVQALEKGSFEEQGMISLDGRNIDIGGLFVIDADEVLRHIVV
jgi:hypothetical protein